ncbi:MAG: D-alanine--D-alanine ligase [Candidatus Omnitrophota bacterium]
MKYGLGRIGVLYGGSSSERDISIKSGQAVYEAITSLGLDAVCIDPKDPYSLTKDISDLGIKVVFIALHGKFGEDGTIQTILDEIGMPYTGSGPEASRLAMDKILSKEIFKNNGIPVPEYKVLERPFDPDSVINGFKLPLVIKPSSEGSSVGMNIVEDEKHLSQAVDEAFSYDNKILIEEYIKAEDIAVGVFEDNPLPVVHIKPKDKFYSFNAKYTAGMCEYVVPAKFPNAMIEEAQRLGILAHRSLGCRFFSRADMLLDEKSGRIVVLEANTIPGLTSTSLLPKAAQAAGIDFPQMCLRLLEAAIA